LDWICDSTRSASTKLVAQNVGRALAAFPAITENKIEDQSFGEENQAVMT